MSSFNPSQRSLVRGCFMLSLLLLQAFSTVEAFSISSRKHTHTILKSSSNNDDMIPTVTRKEQQDQEKLSRRLNENSDDVVFDRRRAFSAIAAATLSSVVLQGSSTDSMTASAYGLGKAFPAELDASDAIVPGKRSDNFQAVSPLDTDNKELALGSVLWGGALWLLSGSRSNPLATPLANIIYDEEKESWLKDRNDGLFAPLPIPFLLLLGVVFIGLGFATNFLAISASESSDISIQSAVVLIISAASLELGRIASGEKKQDREDFDRDNLLEQEFIAFAEQRLMVGGDCHRMDVIRAFRRFYAKYRQPDNPDYPLSDLEIEQLLRNWNKKYAQAETTSAGFYKGIKINVDADIFVQR